MAILDEVLGPVVQQDDQQNIARRLFPWLAPQPATGGPMPVPRIPEAIPPFAPRPDVSRGTSPITPAAPVPAPATGPQAVALGPIAASPAPVPMPTEAVNLGSSLDRPAPMPQAPAAAKLGARGRLEAALVGFASGDPRKAIETAQEIKNKPIADYERQQKQQQEQALTEETQARASSVRSEVPLHEAQATNQHAEAAARANPQPKEATSDFEL